MVPVSAPLPIFDLTSAEFVERASLQGVPRGESLTLYRAVFRDGLGTTRDPHSAVESAASSGDSAGATPEVSRAMQERELVRSNPPLRASQSIIHIPNDPLTATLVDGATRKFVLRHGDGLETESVLIPMEHRRGGTSHTLCVSSQIGCAMGCRFCETAQMGLMKQLTAGQIVGQWHAARHRIGQPVKNIVFMGMGEPMDNLDAVLQAIRILVDHNGPAIPPSNIAVSTVGHLAGIARFGRFIEQPGLHRLNLAVSVNAPNDAIRSSIMPINRGAPMTALREALLAFPKRRTAAICVEYVLIPGVNDAMEHADEICEWLRPLRSSLNVIPYNPRRDSPWRAPMDDEVDQFVARVQANGQFVKTRRTKGRSVMAACGQLGNPSIRRRQFVEEVPLTFSSTRP